MKLVVVVLTILWSFSDAERSSFTNSYPFSRTKHISYGTVRDLNKIIYATYNESQPNSIKRCIITMISDAFGNSTSVIRQCEIDLKPKLVDGTIFKHCWPHQFESDKVILLWGEAQDIKDSEKQTRSVIVKTSVIDMMKNCHTIEASVRKYQVRDRDEMSVYDFRTNIIIFEDTYEILLADTTDVPKPTDCDYVFYKFDAQNRKIFGPHNWPIPIHSNGSCSGWFTIESAQKNRYFITERTDLDKITLATEQVIGQPNGQKQLNALWSISFNKPIEGYRYSLANDAIGLCKAVENSTLICLQYDDKDQIQMEKQSQLEKPYELFMIRVYNLRKGGLLFSVYICSEPTCEQREEYLMEIDKQGVAKAVKFHLDIAHPAKEKHYFDARIFENNQGQYCKARIVTPLENKKLAGVTKTYMSCYSPDMFTAELKKIGL